MKFLVVDDHMLIREALRGVIIELQSDAVVLEAGTCGQAMSLIPQHADLALILLDLQLPDRDGFAALAELRERHPVGSSQGLMFDCTPFDRIWLDDASRPMGHPSGVWT